MFDEKTVTAGSSITKNNEPGGKMVWYPREMKRTNVVLMFVAI
jgi:hypothetical protein